MNKFLWIGLGFLFIAAGLFSYYWQYQNPYKDIGALYKEEVIVVPEEIEEKDYQLKITKIGIEAPVVMDVDGNDKDVYLLALQNGVAHLKNSALPGKEGNTFIFGHSSYYFYDPGLYKNVFARLSDVEIDDEIEILSNKNTYKYKVFEKKSVNPDQIEVANKLIEGKKETLTLMTCTPTGTAWYRLIVIAERVE